LAEDDKAGDDGEGQDISASEDLIRGVSFFLPLLRATWWSPVSVSYAEKVFGL